MSQIFKIEPIVESWVSRVLSDRKIEHARDLTPEILRNHIPTLLERIRTSLQDYREHGGSVWERAEAPDLQDITVQHAHLRHHYHYDVLEVQREFQHLRYILVSTLDISRSEWSLVHLLLDQSMREVTELMHSIRTELEGKLIGIVSHDLQNPLGSVIFNLQCFGRAGISEDRRKQMLSRAVNAATRAQKLVKDLLDFSQLRSGVDLILKRSPVDLGQLVRGCSSELNWNGRDVRIITNGDVRGEWDGARLAQLVSNLMSNAIRHAAPGSVEIELSGYPGHVELEIRNPGYIRDPDQIFDAYRSSDYQHGLGLGLYITRKVAEAHGGSITVRQERGVCFLVTLPR